MSRRLYAHRWRLVAVAIVLLLAINVSAPNYLNVQSADDADEFRKAIGDGNRSRIGAAALFDVAFATSYALVAISFVKSPRPITRFGLALVLGGAASDVLENALLLRGVVRLDDLTDGPVTAMRVCGAVKLAGIIVGAAAMATGRLRSVRSGPY